LRPSLRDAPAKLSYSSANCNVRISGYQIIRLQDISKNVNSAALYLVPW